MENQSRLWQVTISLLPKEIRNIIQLRHALTLSMYTAWHQDGMPLFARNQQPPFSEQGDTMTSYLALHHHFQYPAFVEFLCFFWQLMQP
jgi:hypothetical protein